MTERLRRSEPVSEPSTSRLGKGLDYGRAVGVVFAFGFLVAACSNSGGADSTTSTQSTEQPSVTEASATSGAAHDPELTDKAWAAVVTFFSATNSGDNEAVLALFTNDVAISDSIGGAWELSDWEMLNAWNSAQGTVMTPPDCSVTDDVPGESITITCFTGVHDAPSQAVDGPPVPTTLTTTVTNEGISKLRFGYGGPDFREVGVPFNNWMAANHPDMHEAETIGFFAWSTIEEAAANGILTAEYSAEWAADLKAKNCSYNDGC